MSASPPPASNRLSRAARICMAGAVVLLLLEIAGYSLLLAREGRLAKQFVFGAPGGGEMYQARGLLCTIYVGLEFDRPVRMRLLDMPLRAGFSPGMFGPGFTDPRISMRFAGQLRVPKDGQYQFRIECNAPARVRIGDSIAIDEMATKRLLAGEVASATMRTGRAPFVLEYSTMGPIVYIHVEWRGPGFEWRTLAPDDFLADSMPGPQAP